MKSKLNLSIKFLFLVVTITLFSCNNNDDDRASNGSSYKITITLNDVNVNDDYVSVTAVGNNQSGVINYPMWKINDADQPNIQTISLIDTDFSGTTKTYIVETVNPIGIFTSGFQIINYGQPLTGSLKIERNGKTMVNETINLVGDNTDFTNEYSFNN